VRFDSTEVIQAPPPAGPGLPFTAPVRDVQHGDVHSRIAAGFAKSTFTLLEDLELTVGLRYEYYTARLDRTHVLKAPVQGETLPIVPVIDRETHSSAWLPHGTLAYRVKPPVLIYATIARGYRPGGFSPLTDDVHSAEFDPNFDLSYELGLKTTWLGERLTSNLALFWVHVDGYQVPQRTGLTGFVVANAHSATSRASSSRSTPHPREGSTSALRSATPMLTMTASGRRAVVDSTATTSSSCRNTISC